MCVWPLPVAAYYHKPIVYSCESYQIQMDGNYRRCFRLHLRARPYTALSIDYLGVDQLLWDGVGARGGNMIVRVAHCGIGLKVRMFNS